MARITVFDTTLRDGEQSPGCTMTPAEKLRMARQLEALEVDVIEAGFPIASDTDFDAVRTIAREIREPVIAALARATEGDIDRAGRSLEGARRSRIHTFIATSDIHLERKLGIGRAECLERAAASVERACRFTDDVEFSAEDATRTDLDFLCAVIRAAVEAGATTVNIPDTVGYTFPAEFRDTLRALARNVAGLTDKVTLSVHCHDDLGLAVANSLAGLDAGARQVECTVNGIGERAGNASLEEIVMALKVRADISGHSTGVDAEKLYPASRLLSETIGVEPQPNKAIVGANAFAHAAGIHQHGMLSDRATYEIMTPETVGAPPTQLVLGKHSGRHALRHRYEKLGHDLTREEVAQASRRCTDLAERRIDVTDEALLSILRSIKRKGREAGESRDRGRSENRGLQVATPTGTARRDARQDEDIDG